MGRIRNILKNELNYNFRERANVFAGAALGVVTPVIAVKLGIDCLFQDTETSSLYEASKYGIAIAINGGLSYCSGLLSDELRGFPFKITILLGGLTGIYSAEKLKENRIEKQKNLENIAKKSN